MRSINPLPGAVRSSVRSGVILFDLPRIVEELVFNSLDAGATKVSVYVGIGTCSVKVVDDGSGIPRDGLVLLGERYATSKFHQLADMDDASGSFGFRGEALASISDVSVLEIVTKAFGRPNGYRKVIKGCKCIYLGIDSDRKEAGTTVNVRDLFYNQPVRRKYMQSSPKRVLHSVKKCVLMIALVHSQISFKVIDNERFLSVTFSSWSQFGYHACFLIFLFPIFSGDELLCTHPSSPLSLLKSEFGVEVPDSLHELNVSDDILKLSGYVSGPCDGSEIKAFQYVYINSRFICKGPIHKLLNQLAIQFDCLDPWKINSQKQKRSRSQPYPAYILNLSCPRSLYDLTFEPSKAKVEFKNWAPILTFTEKAIQRFWNDNLTLRIDLSETSEIAKKKGRVKNHKASLDIFSSPSEMLKEFDHLSDIEHDGIPCTNLHKNSAAFKEQQNEMGFVCQNDYAFQSWDGLETKCIPSATCKYENHLLTSDNNFLSIEDNCLKNRSNDDVENSLSSAWGVEFLKVDPVASSELAGTALSCDLVGRDIEKPFLQVCSSQQRLPLERALFANDDGYEFQRDGFRTNWKQRIAHDSVDVLEFEGTKQSFDLLPRTQWQEDASCSQSFTREIKKVDVPAHFDFPSRAFAKSIPSYAEHFIEEDVLEYDSVVRHLGKLGSSHSDWCPLASESLFLAAPWDFEHLRDENALKESPHSGESAGYGHLVSQGKSDCKSGFHITPKGSRQKYCTSTCLYNKVDFDDYACFSRNSCKFFPRVNQEYKFSLECANILPDDTGWLNLESEAKDYTRVDKYESQRDTMGYQDSEQDCVPKKRSRRGLSAPPFYRGKRRFFSLNCPSIMNAGKPGAKIFHNALSYPEDDMPKHAKQPSGAHHLYFKPSSMEHLLSDNRLDVEKMTSISANLKEKEEGDTVEQSCYFGSQDMAPVFFSKKTQDSVNSWSKWRSFSSKITNKNKSCDTNNESHILDISSGFLHLAGDSLVPESINKNCLGNAKVLQQVDKKFIPVVAGGTLAVIDQHAADERIRLEELRKKVFSGEAKTINYLKIEQELILPEIAYQLLQNYAEQIKDWGWICNIHGQDSRSFKWNLNLLHRRPIVVTLLAVPNILGVNLSDVDLLEFLQQLADTDGSSTMPPSVLRVLNMKACRGAIMFGDSLLPSECSLIVEELTQTSLCFQCAHGRPTTIPIVNLEALHKQTAKLGSLGDNPNKLWHGLHRQELSIDRAAQRLGSARA
ncbi:hypothetical protein I3843_07G002300 [Carya illinoinensis]|nr:hypothetical protein I3760_07G002100 [Carya illinoinensis]KAG2695165.1 hypothetical protein I3760_07G002100 [Carya illinoinensis]KAG7968869.1 hypothetical protein I3843_07G002300 [Carya illinoinensis]